MKPTITNAFTVGTTSPSPRASRRSAGRMRDKRADSSNASDGTSAALASMQVDLREAGFGCSLELSPIQAVDAVNSLLRACPPGVQFLVSVEQSAWRDGNADAGLAVIADRLGIEALEVISPDQLVLDGPSLQTLVAIALPQRVLAVAVDGAIEPGDARAMNRAVEAGRSPLTAELRAFAAVEVLGDRSLVLHTPIRAIALHVVAENLRQYLGAILDKTPDAFVAPELAQIDALASVSGAITVRPIETHVSEESVDVGVNTSIERFTRPATTSLIYDRASNTWHAE